MALGQGEKPRGESGEPVRVRRRQRDREQRPARRGAHRGEVGEIDGERLVAERARLRAGREVPALDQHVGGDRELEARVRAQQRAIVADPDQRPFRRTVEVAADDLELVQAMFLARATSSGRSATAIFSSTPLMKRWPSAAP